MTQTHPAAVEIGGIPYLHNAKGNLVAISNIKATDLLVDETVLKMTAYAEDISAELVRFQSHTYADIAGMDAMMDQEYGVTRPETSRGNRTFTSYDSKFQVKVCVADQIAFGPELQSAKKLLDELILERSEGADPLLVALVTQAFSTQKEGKVDVASILALRRLEVPDPRWANITRAIDDSVKVEGSKSYLRFYRRSGADDRWRMIPLDLAAVEPTAAAFERKSLRRQVADLRAELAELLAEPEEAEDPDFPPRLVDDLFCAEEHTVLAVKNLECAMVRGGASDDTLNSALLHLNKALVDVRQMFADAKSAQAAE